MKCPVCKKEFKYLKDHFEVMNNDKLHIEYKIKMYLRIKGKLLNDDIYLKDIPKKIEEECGLYCSSSWVFAIKNKENPLMDYGIKNIDSINIPENFIYLLKNEIDHNYIYNSFQYTQPSLNTCSVSNCSFPANKLIHIDGDQSNFLITNLEVYCNKHYGDIERNQPSIRIEKDFKFDSAHNLLNGYEGKCKNVHGHTYKLRIAIKNKINPKNDMVMDFGKLKEIVKEFIIEKLDHKNLNSVMDFNTTAERMVFWIWKVLEQDALLKGLVEIKLWETEDSCAILNYKDVLKCENYLKTYMLKIGV